ncbi:MAG: hypothetical protein HQ559_17905 [Lentisphaerae bacterium]|nr:hypothetical protein [Lentisphaerota bacterium]
MKTHTLVVVVLLAVSILLPAGPAQGRGADVPRGSILTTKNLGILSTGVEFEQQIRGVTMDTGERVTLEGGLTHAFLSLDIFKWLTIQGGAGAAVSKIRQEPVPSSSDFMWNAAMKVGL